MRPVTGGPSSPVRIRDMAERLLDTTIQTLRNIPHLALIPLAILWFGIGEEAKVFLVALGVFFPLYLNTFHGIRSVDPALIKMGRIYGLKGFLEGDLARGNTLHSGGVEVFLGHHVADSDRGGNHRQ